MKPTVPPSFALLLLLVFAASCRDGGRDPGAEAGDVELTVVSHEVYTVGAFSGEDWETFGRIADVDFDASGNLHILDEGSYRVVVVDQGGGLVRMVGSQGEGPGELSAPMSAAILGDGRLVVYDMGIPGAFEIFDQQGGFVGSTALDPLTGMPGPTLLPLGGDRMVTTGGMTVRMPSQSEPDEPPEDDHLRAIDVFSLDGSGKEVLYRAWNLPPEEVTGEISGGDAQRGRQFAIRLPRHRAFGPRLHIAVLPSGHLAVVDSIGYRVKLIDGDGTVDGVIERDISPEPVTEAIQEAERARQLEQLMESGGPRIRLLGELASGEFAEQLREQMLPMVENMLFPEEIPVIADLGVDDEGRLWIARTAPGGSGDGPIDIVTAEGDYMGTLSPDALRIPDAFGPDGLMAYIETDEMDVPSVRVVRLESLAGGS